MIGLPWVWVLLAVIMGILEMATGTLMFLLFAIAALLAGLAGFLGLPVVGQAVVFLCGGLGAAAVAPALIRRLDRGASDARFGVDALIDEIGVVTLAIDPLDGTGMIKVAGELWRAQASVPVPVGSQVRVDAVSGTKLMVHPLPPDAGRAGRLSGDQTEQSGDVTA